MEDTGRRLLRDLTLTQKHGLSNRQLMRALAARQKGYLGTRQAQALEVKRTEVRALQTAGEIHVVRPGVWRFASAVSDPDPAVVAFLLGWPYAVISHASAAAYHGLVRVALPAEPVITVPHGRTCRPSGIVVHHAMSLTSDDILRVGPLRYTTLARNVCDLANIDEPWESLSILDDAVAAGARRKWIHQRATALSSGRSGVALIARATEPGAADEFRSWLERAGASVFALGGLPPAQWNVEIRNAGRRIAVVDALWLPERVVCELKGLRFHTTAAQLRRDDQRLNDLLDAGYTVRAIGWRDLVGDPRGAVMTVLRAMRAAGSIVDFNAVPAHIRVPARPFP